MECSKAKSAVEQLATVHALENTGRWQQQQQMHWYLAYAVQPTGPIIHPHVTAVTKLHTKTYLT
eukprot:9045637-Prorocentrum_lima.AAC.1